MRTAAARDLRMFFFADAMFGTEFVGKENEMRRVDSAELAQRGVVLTHQPTRAKLLKIAPFRRLANPLD